MSDKTLKRVILALNIVLFGGLLAFSIIFFVINKMWNPMNPQNAGFDIKQRFFWRSTAEIIMLTCGRIHLIGHGVVLLIALVKKKILSAAKLTLYYSRYRSGAKDLSKGSRKAMIVSCRSQHRAGL